jgi:acetate kinase
MDAMGIELDSVRNAVRAGTPRLISADSSRVSVAVVPTDEELEIAQQTFAVVRRSAD